MGRGVAVVTGASSGIGAATARRLATEGFDVVVGARRIDRLEEVASEIGARAIPLDVTDPGSVATFCAEVSECRVLVNNAGGALGRDPVEHADDDEWRWMYEANVMGVMRMTKALLPALEASLRAVTKVLRLELLGRPVRVTSIDPGMTETAFSVVRFHGDEQKASAVYAGTTPLVADDIADCIAFAVTRPSHVNIDTMVVLPRDQASAGAVSRRHT